MQRYFYWFNCSLMPRLPTYLSGTFTYILILGLISTKYYIVSSHIYYKSQLYYNFSLRQMLKLKGISSGMNAEWEILSQWIEELLCASYRESNYTIVCMVILQLMTGIACTPYSDSEFHFTVQPILDTIFYCTISVWICSRCQLACIICSAICALVAQILIQSNSW